MNRKNYYTLLIAAAVCSAAFAFFADGGTMLLSILQFPFGPIGDFLRWLSLAGTAENILAWIMYVCLCILPAAIWLFLRRKGTAVRADILLLLLSPVLAVVLYNSINPYGSYIASLAGTELHKAQYGGVVYVMLLSWLILRTVHAFRNADESALYKALGVFLKLLGVLFVVSAFGGCFGALLGSVESARTANQNSGSLALTYVFLTLQCIVDALPELLNTAAVVIALDLLEAFTSDDEHTADRAERLADWCGTTLTVTAVTAVVFHVLQMLCIGSLRNVNVSVSFPVGAVAFLLVCLIAARIIAENKALKDDNDLFI